MPVDDQVAVEQQNTPPAGQHPDKQARTRQSDEGPAILPGMQHFVTLLRKAKRPGLVLLLVERASNTLLPELSALTDAAKGILPIQSRKAMFHAVAKLSADVQQRIERAAERVVLLDDEYGAQAVQSLLDEQDVGDAAILAMPSDRYSRALHLCLLQDFPENGAKREQRFDHAERLQVMHRQWKSENYSSHYLGPKGVVPKVDANAEDVLRARIAALFPQVAPDQILIEQFTRRDLAHADRCGGKDADEATPVLLHTLTATFNGSTAHFQQVANGEVIDHEEPAAMSASFSWEPDTGALGVFCEDREVRRDLATAFRDVVLACEGEINDMPMREFDLFGFSTPAMLKRLEQDRVAGIEKISILQIKIARPFEQQTTDEANGRDLIQHLSSTLLIGRDRRDTRNIYQLAYDDYGLDDLTGYALAQVKLVVRMAKQPHRKAHNVAVQITSPNGLNDKSKTEDDRKRVLEQLVRIGVLREF
ncbi:MULTISPECIES: hypothetical protein [Burkholderia cepacia complex]|uniref:hypothetical protein n=1 Tax=Burkholderia cepacia complex TaxID=87882 RepID=UPI001C239E2D|nr:MULTISPECIES: hypothetical protein [Burkholderia cepacia complex]MBU9249579.1 hypothetical protein [Burkholderia multivorans]MBY4831606.1 hypothetical protein [Burkholderia dolosa]UXZ83382.1 hypothetical protein NUJ31_04990 [Burkholderia multivorans]